MVYCRVSGIGKTPGGYISCFAPLGHGEIKFARAWAMHGWTCPCLPGWSGMGWSCLLSFLACSGSFSLTSFFCFLSAHQPSPAQSVACGTKFNCRTATTPRCPVLHTSHCTLHCMYPTFNRSLGVSGWCLGGRASARMPRMPPSSFSPSPSSPLPPSPCLPSLTTARSCT